MRHHVLSPGARALIGLTVTIAVGCNEPTATIPSRTLEPLAATTAATTLTPTWFNEPGGVGIAVDASDNVFTARWDYNPAGDIYVAKRNAAGALQWEVRFDNTDNTRHEVATWVETDPSGNVLVSGTIRSGYSNPVNANSLLMKFAPGGALLWRRVYAANFDGSSTRKVLVDASGNAYVLGIGISPTGQRTSVRKFAPDGTTLWTWFDPSGIGAPLNFKFTPDGNIVVAARGIYGSINGFAKLDRNGATLWTLPAFKSLTIGDVAGDAAGNSYLVNASTTSTGALLRKIGPTGATLWERAIAFAGLRVEVGSDQSPVISGYPAGSFGAAFAKYDPSGTILWTNLDADGPALSLLAHAQMKLDGSNNAYLAAGTMSLMGVVKVLGATGATDWTSTISYGYSQAMAFGASNRLYVVGGTTARLDQAGSPPPPVNTPPVVTIAATTTTIPVGGIFRVRATFVDPDPGDGPWAYTWRWGNGPTSGSWATPATYDGSRVYPQPGAYNVRVIVTDRRGSADTSNIVRVTVR